MKHSATLPDVDWNTLPIRGVECVYRGDQVGKADCGCAGKSKVFWCHLLQGHTTQKSTGKTWSKVSIGSKTIERIGKLKPCLHCHSRATCEIQRLRKQQQLTDLIAVTALSPKLHKIEHQRMCLQSWRDLGLRIIAKNTTEEIRSLRETFIEVDQWIACNDVTTAYAYPTQKIVNLARTAAELSTNVLLINSDIELYGDQDWLQFDEHTQFTGIRWNYESKPEFADEFEWGLDAFTFTPKQSLMLPEDMPYGIGQAMWDYAVPAIMKAYGVRSTFLHRPFLFHRNHPQNWSESGWHFGADWLAKRFGVRIKWGDSSYRQNLEPSMEYRGKRYVPTCSGLDAIEYARIM